MEKQIKTSKSIFDFKKGDIIIRLYPVNVSYEEFSEILNTMTRKSYLNHSHTIYPVEFIGIENNLIYVRELKKPIMGSKKVHIHNLESFSNGWALFIVPDGLVLEDCLSPY